MEEEKDEENLRDLVTAEITLIRLRHKVEAGSHAAMIISDAIYYIGRKIDAYFRLVA